MGGAFFVHRSLKAGGTIFVPRKHDFCGFPPAFPHTFPQVFPQVALDKTKQRRVFALPPLSYFVFVVFFTILFYNEI